MRKNDKADVFDTKISKERKNCVDLLDDDLAFPILLFEYRSLILIY